MDRQIKEQIQRAQSEEGDMPKPIKAAAMAGVATQPIFAMKVQPQCEARNKAQNDPCPGNQQIELNPYPYHERTVSRLASDRIIDKT